LILKVARGNLAGEGQQSWQQRRIVAVTQTGLMTLRVTDPFATRDTI